MNDTPRTDAEIAGDLENLRDHVQETSCYWALAGHSRQLERELAEAREDCEVTSRIAEEMTKQRDRLAEALRKVIDPRCSDREKFIHAGEALAAMKGEQP